MIPLRDENPYYHDEETHRETLSEKIGTCRSPGSVANFYQRGVDPVTVGKRYKYFLDGAWGQFTGENG